MTKPVTTTGCLQKLFWLAVMMGIASVVGWFIGRFVVNYQQQQRLAAIEEAQSEAPKTGLALKNEIRSRRLNTGLSSRQFQTLIDDWIWFQRNQLPPEENDLDDPPPGTEQERLEGAIAILDSLETLSPDALIELRQNPSDNRRQWIPRINQLRLSSWTFEELVNDRFRQSFASINPDPDSLEDRPFALIWNALGFDTLLSLESESHYQKLSLREEPEVIVFGKLEPGKGYAYAIEIEDSQFLELQLQAQGETRISLYSPTGEDIYLNQAAVKEWSGLLGNGGFYELVLTTTGDTANEFQLQLNVR